MDDILEPIFSSLNIVREITSERVKPEPQWQSKQDKTSKSTEHKRIVKKTAKNIQTPSIKEALAGRYYANQEISAKEQHQLYSASDETNEFSTEDLKEKWELFLTRLDDRPNLQSTLSRIPEIKDDFKLSLEIENTVQDDLINIIKPELVSYLRKELRNSKIQLVSEITEKAKGIIIYTDEEKYEELVKKNPSLALLRKKLNLDFG